MYINDAKFYYHVYGRNTAVITFKDVDDKEIREINDIYRNGSDVTLTKKDIATIDINTDAIRSYAERDVNCTKVYYETFVADAFNRYKENVTMRNLKVEKVIFNEPATIVFWSDNTKTKAVCREDDKYDAEKGFYICCAKKLFGNDFKAGGKINKALEKAIVQTKEVEE